MSERGLRLDGLNLVARDLETTIEFYRRLGLSIPDEKVWRTDSGPHHVDGIRGGSDVELNIDSQALAGAYNAGHDEKPPGSATVIGFGLESRAAVDELHAELVAAGYESRQEPYDAFWGTRYAVVADPDGRDVGLMSPSDPQRRTAPPDL